jgi:hypothetical protein
MDEIHRIEPAPERPALVQNPPALADLLDEHKRQIIRPGHQQHPDPIPLHKTRRALSSTEVLKLWWATRE